MRLQLLAFAVLAGCASGATPGAQPHDMSVAGHEAMARGEDREAAKHSAQYDPYARTNERCATVRASTPVDPGVVCWSSSNPTAQHLDEARRHQKMAADHRAASSTLRDAEARSCNGVSDRDRDISPFAHREDIESVQPLDTTVSGKNQFTRRNGAVIVFRALPGMTTPWLQRVVDCHLARNAALGHDVPEMPYCPLVPKDVTATVKEARGGFAIEVRSDDPDVAQEIWRRAQGLQPTR